MHGTFRLLAVAIAIAATVTFSVWGKDPAQSSRSKIRWHYDLKTAYKASQNSEKPLFIVFGGPNCTYCSLLERDVLNDSTTAQYINSKFVAVHLDIKKNFHEAKILEVENIPATYLLNSDGDLLASVVGYVDKLRFRQALQKGLEYNADLAEAELAKK